MTAQDDSQKVTEVHMCYTLGKHITCLIICSECRLRFVFSGKQEMELFPCADVVSYFLLLLSVRE